MSRRVLRRTAVPAAGRLRSSGLGFACRLAAACSVLLALSCGSASAVVVPKGSFGSFPNAEGLAIDSSSGDVYVYDATLEAILKFDAEGNPVNFSATGTNQISEAGSIQDARETELAIDNSSGPAKGDLYLARGGLGPVQIYSSAGDRIGELENEELSKEEPGHVCGVAVDPSGAVYVGMSSGHINKYVPTANPVTNADLASSIFGLEDPCKLTVDSAGNVFVTLKGNGPVTRYAASQFGSLSPEGAVADTYSSALAVDPLNEDLYVNENSSFSIFGPQGEPFEAPLATFGNEQVMSGSGAIAVSGFNGYVYVPQNYAGTHGIEIFADLTTPLAISTAASAITGTSATLNGAVNPDGSTVTSCRFEYGTTTAYGQSASCAEEPGSGTNTVAVHADVTGLLPGATYHYRLVAVNANGISEAVDRTFDTLAAPEVTNVTASRLTATEANIGADINPHGSSTTYVVEYGTSEAYGQSTRSFELPAQDTEIHGVTIELAGLSPNTSYHARVLATSALGVASSSDVAFTTRSQVASSCVNEALRAGLSARLPDCRAYERVSPQEKEGASVGVGAEFPEIKYRQTGGLVFRAASDGASLYYFANNAVAGSPAGGETFYQADRGSTDWLTTPLDPPNLLNSTHRAGVGFAITADYRYVSKDLSCKILQTAEPLTADTPPADVEAEMSNLYRRNADGTYTLISNTVPSNRAQEAVNVQYTVVGATPDCKKIVFKSTYLLLPEAPIFGEGLYEWDNGTLRVADVLPEGNRPLFGVELFGSSSSNMNRFSQDGSRIYFEAFNNSFEKKLYLREGNGTPGTRIVDVAASETATQAGPAFYQVASKNGVRVFFQDNAGLTPGNPSPTGGCSPETGVGCDLYEYNAESEKLTDLSVDTNPADPEGAGVLGSLGISDDGAYVYFAAKGQLTPSSGDPGENTAAQNQSEKEANVYLAHGGSLSFVGRISDDLQLRSEAQTSPESAANDLVSWPNNLASRVTPDGKALLFMSLSKVTSYDNTDALLGTHDPEAYLYSAGTGKTVCVSCNPSGARPAYLSVRGERIHTAIVPLTTGNSQVPAPENQPHALSDSGRVVFFESTDRLSPIVKSNEVNVYEWEQAGSGTCTSTSSSYVEASEGCVDLLDSGLATNQFASPALFLDASSNGDDAFMLTGAKLSSQDEDNLNDIYDLKVDGGLAGKSPVAPCEGEACQGLAPGTPTFGTPASSSFSGEERSAGAASSSKKQRPPTRAQKLARALRVCAKKKGARRRQACRNRARKRYGAKTAGKSAAITGGRR